MSRVAEPLLVAAGSDDPAAMARDDSGGCTPVETAVQVHGHHRADPRSHPADL